MTASMLTTKLYIPPARANRVTRPYLLERLDAGLRPDVRLVLLSAPAGFGKTTLLSEWIALRRDEALFCWLSLDEGDNDPLRFLHYLVAALQTAVPGLGQAALALLQAPVGAEGLVSMKGALNALLNELAAQFANASPTSDPLACASLFLVLDDYHLIDSPEVHSALGYLVDHLPPHAHLVMATRSDPPLPFPRLRARDQICELRVSDLRFNTAEAAAFLNDVMQLNLSAEDVTALEARTEGWIAGLQLASLAARSAPDRSSVSSFVAAFAGSNRYILDYLVEEILTRQPAGVQDFLLKTSVLDRFSAELCEFVIRDTGCGDPLFVDPSSVIRNAPLPSAPESRIDESRLSSPQLILEYLERSNLFIVPLDGERRWYRYHNLFAEFLYNRLCSLLDQEAPGASQERVRELHRCASAWFEGHALPHEAIEYAIRAGDFPRAADLIEKKARWAVLVPGETSQVLRWLEAIPEEITLAHPGLCLAHAWVLLSAGHNPAAEPHIAAALRAAKNLPEAENLPEAIDLPLAENLPREVDSPTAYNQAAMYSEVDAIRSLLAVMAGQLDEAIFLAKSALERLSEDSLLLRSLVAFNLGLAYDMRGDVAAAAPVYRQAVALSRAAGNLLVTMIAAVQLADLELLQGQPGQAEASYRQAVQLADRLGGLPVTGMTYSGLGHILYEQNRLDEAAEQLEIAIRLGQAWESQDILAISQVYQAQVQLAQGQPAAALELIAQAETNLQGSLSSPSTVYSARALIARVWLRAGRVDAAARWAREFQEQPVSFRQAYLRVIEGATLVRVYMALGQPAQAAEAAARLLPGAQPGEISELKALQALALDAQGQNEAAIHALAEALELVSLVDYTHGYSRLFLDEGAPMARLLRAALTRGVQPARTAALLDAFDPALLQESGPQSYLRQANCALVEPLSERELDVLRLAAQGLTNQAIAARLVVAVSTVKTHINHIYGKLGVETRTQAVAKARELRLIE